MVSAVSTSILAPNAPPPAPPSTGKPKKVGVPAAIKRLPWFAETDLSDEQDKAMNKARATAVFRQILRQLNRKAYAAKRPTVREQAQAGLLVGVGVKGLARLCQCNPSTVRDRLDWLEANGYVQRLPNTVEIVTRDPLTGQIKTNVIGRRKATAIQLTTQACHCRPRKKPKGFDRGTQNPDTGHWVNHDRGTGAPPSVPDSVRYRGTGAPTFPSNSSFPIAERQPPASGESGSGSRSTKPDEQRQPRPFTGTDADRLAATRKRLEREKAQREAEDAALAAEREARAADRPDSLEATPMNPATVRAADAATAAGKPPHSIRESRSDDRPRTAVLPRPTPSQPRPPTAADRAALDVLNDTPKEVIEAKQWKGFNSRKEMLLQQLAADTLREAERASNGVAMTRATIPIEQQPKESAPGLLKQVWQRLTG